VRNTKVDRRVMIQFTRRWSVGRSRAGRAARTDMRAAFIIRPMRGEVPLHARRRLSQQSRLPFNHVGCSRFRNVRKSRGAIPHIHTNNNITFDCLNILIHELFSVVSRLATVHCPGSSTCSPILVHMPYLGFGTSTSIATKTGDLGYIIDCYTIMNGVQV